MENKNNINESSNKDNNSKMLILYDELQFFHLSFYFLLLTRIIFGNFISASWAEMFSIIAIYIFVSATL